MFDHRDEYEFCLDVPQSSAPQTNVEDFDDELTPIPTGDDDPTEPAAVATCQTYCGSPPAYPGNAFCLDCEADIGTPA